MTFQLLKTETVDSNIPILMVSYTTNGLLNDLVLTNLEPHVLEIDHYVGYPDSYGHYVDIAQDMVGTADIDEAQLPQGQALSSQMEQTRQDTLNSGAQGMDDTAKGKHDSTENYLEGLAEKDRQELQEQRDAVNKDPFDDCSSSTFTNSDCH